MCQRLFQQRGGLLDLALLQQDQVEPALLQPLPLPHRDAIGHRLDFEVEAAQQVDSGSPMP